MPPLPHRRAIPPLLRAVLVSSLALTAATTAWARGDDLSPCADGLPPGTTLPAPDWRTVVDVGHAFAVRLPAGHALSGAGDGAWYVHGFLDGSPLVPDVAIYALTGITIDDAVARDFPPGAEVERIRLGPATSGARVDATYAAPDRTPYRQTSYLVATEHGVLRVDRYEGFDWDGFDAVACSVHGVELVE